MTDTQTSSDYHRNLIIKDAKKVLRKYRAALAVFAASIATVVTGAALLDRSEPDTQNQLNDCANKGIDSNFSRDLEDVGTLQLSSEGAQSSEFTIVRPNGDQVKVTLGEIRNCQEMYSDLRASRARNNSVPKTMAAAGSVSSVLGFGYAMSIKAQASKASRELKAQASRSISR